MTTLLPDWLGRRAQTHADHTALDFGGEVLTFAELEGQADRFDKLLRARGVRSGDVVATLLHNHSGLVTLVHAIPRDGRILAPLGIRLKSPEVTTMLESCAARVLIYEEATTGIVDGIAALDSLTRICIDEETLSAETSSGTASNTRSSAEERINLGRTHSIVFTSGTSGVPKPVRLTWGNHYWSAMGSALNLGVNPGDRWLCCLPLNHVGGLSILMRSVLYGNTVELQEKFQPEEVNAAIHDRGATVVSVVANMLQRMLDANGDRPYPPSLRAILVGGGPTPEALIQRCRRQQVPILLTYGLSETASQVATVRPGDDAVGTGVGRPLTFAEIRVVDQHRQIASAGTHGSIQIRGPAVSPGYLGAEDRTPDDWLGTRDRGWIDDRGYLHVLGRGDDTVVCGGENVHPREIELALEGHPKVVEAFATGIPDEQWGHVLHAAVRTTGSVDEAQLTEHCRTRLAGYKIPRRIVVVDDFPRTPAGKIARAAAARGLREPPVRFTP